jgi:hypothetical protein
MSLCSQAGTLTPVMHRHVPFAISRLAACALAFYPLFGLSPADTTPLIRTGLVDPTSSIGRNDRQAPEVEFENQT